MQNNHAPFKKGDAIQHPVYGLCCITKIQGEFCTLTVLPKPNLTIKFEIRQVALAQLHEFKHAAIMGK